MIAGGNATVYVSDMDRSVRFYRETLGMTLTNRFGNHWATVQAGTTLVIGLHPWSPKHPPPGIVVGGVIEAQEANYIQFEDPDGNPIYVGDRDPAVEEP